MPSRRSRLDGFTLTELLVTMAVIAILAMIAVPSFSGLMRRHRVSTVANQLLADLAYARSEAVIRARFVSVCASSDGASCSGSTNYAEGWLVYAYPTGTAGPNQSYDASKPEVFAVLRRTGARKGVAVTATDGTNLVYGQQGQAKRDLTASPFGFVVCSRAEGSGQAENTSTVPGLNVGVIGSGGVMTRTLAVGDSCS